MPKTTLLSPERERARRIGLNEAMFREINERLEALQERSSGHAGELDLVCECAHRDCATRLTMTVDEYKELRSDPLRFAVLAGHELPQFEDVIERTGNWLVVRKHEGDPAVVPRATA